MRKRHLVLLATVLLVFAAPLRACDDEEAQAYLIDEVLRLSHEGVPDRIIIKQMRTMDFVFCLTADDIIELRELGVSDDILEAMIETSLEVEEGRRQETVNVRVSAGYWSPWYRYPSGWGAYYDPFPYAFSFHYYPFLYECGYWYGWSPNTYYYTYYVYDYCPPQYTPHQGDYREERQLYVERNRNGIIVDDPLSGLPVGGTPVAQAPAPRQRTPETNPGVLQGSVDGGAINVRGPYRSPTVVTPPLRSANEPQTLSEAKSDVINVRNPSTPVEVSPGRQTTRPAVRPPVTTRTEPPTVNRRPPTPVKSPPRVSPKRGSTTRQPPSTPRSSTIVKTPPKRTVSPVTPSKRTPTRVTVPPKRTPTRTQVKAPTRSAPTRSTPPPKASRPPSKARGR